MDRKRFLKDSDRTGRFIVKSLVTGKRYFVEPIGNSRPAEWGDLDPATKKMTGDYGDKYEGCVSEKESIITALLYWAVTLVVYAPSQEA